ncbi:MAG TPA: ribosome biogenesis GTP-binding protein YihA/YsxC [Burkholderiales bacterium]|nr:ribosome biogenesis GTP-binding protein YihA/YsxC [Burkholderiales bacterium]
MFDSVSFLLSAGELHQLPPDRGAEVAFAGRSNAGKSSAINAICGRRKLAFVSRTPGRTQVINFFQLGSERRLVDLPGYGYANVPAALRARWEALLGAYLRTRHALCGLILVMDARHPLTPLDRRMLHAFAVTGRPVHVLMSKADKLSRSAAQRQQVETEQALIRLYPCASVQLFSSATSLGLDRAREALAGMLGVAGGPDELGREGRRGTRDERRRIAW